MGKLSKKIFIGVSVLLLLAPLFKATLSIRVWAQEGNALVSAGKQETANCFDYYQFQKIAMSFELRNKSEWTVIPGETLQLLGTVENKTQVPIANAQIKYRLGMVTKDEDVRRTQGDQIFDEGVLLTGINLQTGEKKEIKARYILPKILPKSGLYQLNLYLTQENQVNWAGLYFTDDVIGSFLPLTVETQDKPLPFFNRSGTKVNGKKHSHIGYLNEPLALGEKIDFQNLLVNPSVSSVSGVVKTNLFFWDQQDSRRLLDTRRLGIRLAPGEEKSLVYSLVKAKEPIYLLEQIFESVDPQTDLSYRTTIFTRVMTNGERARINSLGLSRFPLQEAGRSTFYVCYHNTSDLSDFHGKILAKLSDGKGNVLANLAYTGSISPEIEAIKRDVAFKYIPDKVVASAQILDQKGNIVDKLKVNYNCNDFIDCPVDKVNVGVRKGRLGLNSIGADRFKKIGLKFAIFLGVFALFGGGFFLWRRLRRSRSSILSLAVALVGLVGFFIGMAHPVEAAWSKVKSVYLRGGTFNDSISNRCGRERHRSKSLDVSLSYFTSIMYGASASVDDNSTVCPGAEIIFNPGNKGLLSGSGSVTKRSGGSDTPLVYFRPPPADGQELRNWASVGINTVREGIALGTFVYGRPGLSLRSSNPSIISCSGSSCVAKSAGRAQIEVVAVTGGGSHTSSTDTGGGEKGVTLGVFCASMEDDNDKCSSIDYPTLLSCGTASRVVKHEENFTIPDQMLGTLNLTVGESDICGAPGETPHSPPIASCAAVSKIDSNSATVSWDYRDADGDAQAGWELQGSTDVNFGHLDFNKSGTGSATSTDVTGLVPNTKYYWRIKVKDTRESWGDWSNPDAQGCNFVTSEPTLTATLTPPPATSTPAQQLTEAPTPKLPASCSCLNSAIDHPDLTRVKRGDTLHFTAEAYVDTPDTARVLNMVYRINHVNDKTGELEFVTESGEIDAIFDRQDRIKSKDVHVYKTSWSYKVKDTDPEGLYKVDIRINCGWKITGLKVKGEVEGEQTKREGELLMFKVFRHFINQLLGSRREEKVKIKDNEVPFPTTVKPTGSSLQLGTFMPVPTLPPSGCTWVYYQISVEK